MNVTVGPKTHLTYKVSETPSIYTLILWKINFQRERDEKAHEILSSLIDK